MASSAFAQSDCTKTVPRVAVRQGRPDGRHQSYHAGRGRNAAAAGDQGRQGHQPDQPLVDGVPLFGSRFTKSVLDAGGLAPGAALGKNDLTYAEDTWLSQSHVGTHLDGMGTHRKEGDCYYNQTPMGKNINQNNMTKLGLEHLKPLCHARVFIDLVKVYQQANKLKTNASCRTPCIDKERSSPRKICRPA